MIVHYTIVYIYIYYYCKKKNKYIYMYEYVYIITPVINYDNTVMNRIHAHTYVLRVFNVYNYKLH